MIKPKFKVGDKVKCLFNRIGEWDLEVGKTYTIKSVETINDTNHPHAHYRFSLNESKYKTFLSIDATYLDDRFKKVNDFKQKIKFVKELI